MAPATASAVAYGGGVAECAARAQSVRATLTRMRGVSSSVLDILGSMDSKFSELEATMRPIQSRTQALTRVHDNLEAACEVASDILEKFDKPRLLEPKLARGPGHSLQSLQLYLSRVREVQEAITFLESIQHFQSAEEVLRHARALLSTCTAKLEDTFRATLEQHLPKELPPSESSSAGGPALKPTRSQVHNANEQLLTQLSSLTVEEDEGNAKSPKGTPPAGKLAEAVEQPSSGGGVEYPEVAAEAVQRLQLMVAALVSLGQQKRCVVIYLQSRSTWVEQSMNALGAEGLRNPEEWSGVAVDWEALQERSTLWLRFSVVMVRRLFVRELHLVQSNFVGSHAAEEPHDGQEGEQQQSRPPPLRPPHQVSRQRREGIAGRAFDGTVAPCMALLQNFAQAVALGKLMPEKVFALLHMIDTVEELMLELKRATSTSRSNIKVLVTHMRQLLQTLVEGAREIFEELEDAVRKDSSKHIVSDGSIHPLTSYVFNYVKRLLEYDSAFRTLFAGAASKSRRREEEDDDEEEELSDLDFDEDDDDGGENPAAAEEQRRASGKEEVLHGLWPGRDRSDAQLAREERRAAVAVAALFDALRTNLEAKAKSQYTKSVAQQHFFLMNNYHYVVHSMRQYQLLPLLGDRWARELEEAVEAEAQACVEVTWGKLAGQLKSCQLHLGAAGQGGEHMSKAQRHTVKDCFKAFNAELLETIGQQTSWAVTDDSLRARVRALVQASLVQCYQQFFHYAQELPFTKNPHKYFKYQPEEVQQMTSSLFHA